MLILDPTLDLEILVGVEHAAEVGDQLAVYFEAPRGVQRQLFFPSYCLI